MTLGKRLRHLRLERRMTIKEAAALLEISPSTYRDWEYGRKFPAEVLPKIAKSFGVSLAEVMGPGRQVPGALVQAVEHIEKGLRLLKGL